MHEINNSTQHCHVELICMKLKLSENNNKKTHTHTHFTIAKTRSTNNLRYFGPTRPHRIQQWRKTNNSKTTHPIKIRPHKTTKLIRNSIQYAKIATIFNPPIRI